MSLNKLIFARGSIFFFVFFKRDLGPNFIPKTEIVAEFLQWFTGRNIRFYYKFHVINIRIRNKVKIHGFW